MLRHIFHIALLVALGTSSLSVPASAATSLSLGRSNPIAEAELPAQVGLQLGFFKEHDLDVKFVDFAGGSRLIQAMTAGSVGIGVTAATSMALVAKGAPLLAICENTATLPYFAVGVPFDSPVHNVAELKGKKIAVSSIGSLTDWLAQELVRKEGWPPDAVTRVAIDGNPVAVAAAFRQHLVDAYIGGTMNFAQMEEKHIGRLLTPVSTYMGKVASAAIYASDDMMKTDPATIRAFLAAWTETTRFMSTHKAETVAIESAFTGYAPELIAKEYDIDLGMFTNDCRFDAQSVEALRQSFLDLNVLSEPLDMSKLYTEAYLPAK